jgi:hypothetical protein
MLTSLLVLHHPSHHASVRLASDEGFWVGCINYVVVEEKATATYLALRIFAMGELS